MSKIDNITQADNCSAPNCVLRNRNSVNLLRNNENNTLNTLQNKIENITSLAKLKATLISVDGDPSCTRSEILTNVTLKNGLHSGKFKDRGSMEDINQCVKICCLLDKCDLAFMLQNTCFSVECHNRLSCDAVTAKSSIYSPTICYVYVKSAPNIT